MGMLNRVFRRNSPKAPTAPDHGLSTLEAKPESSDGHQTGTPDGSPHLDALDVMADMIYRTGCTLGYFHYDQQLITGVCIRSKYGHIRSSPPAEPRFLEFERAVAALNAKVVAKIWCKPVEVVMRTLIDPKPELYELSIDSDTRIQILDGIKDIARARKSQYAAFVRDEGVLVVWADAVDQLIPSAEALERSLIDFLWSDEKNQFSSSPVLPQSISSSFRLAEVVRDVPEAAPPAIDGGEDPQKTAVVERSRLRPVLLLAPLYSGAFVAMVIVLLGLLLQSLLIRYILDRNAVRLALAAVLPFLGLIAMWPCFMVVSNLFRMFGPIAQFRRNSAFFSAIPPSKDHSGAVLPITIQMPVYKESLEEVIIPTIESVKKATATFERQGGVVNIIVCDDGLQVLPEEEKARRIRFYRDNNMGYVARSPHGEDGFVRRGAFKKASNLNFCNEFTLRIEEALDELRGPTMISTGKVHATWSQEDEEEIYEQALQKAIEVSPGKTWAEGRLRFGELILLIDADTRVPEDCLFDGSLEMLRSPEVAFLQHASGCLKVANHFLEKALSFFLEMVQITIPFNVASGDCPPLMGHNVFLRWAALQDCATVDRDDGVRKVWPEDLVSEDLALGLQIQCKGWKVRWATYSSLKFEEGVSLTCNDEVARWRKYSYGVGDVLFNPIKYWPTRGPLAKTSLDILRSRYIPPYHKATLFAYFFSYYGLGSAWFLPIITYVLIGVFAWDDNFYVSAWTIFLVCLLLFPGFNNLGFFILYYRLKVRSLGKFVWDLIKWIPFFYVFFAGLSLEVSRTLIYQVLGLSMSWGSTLKSVEKSNFFQQVPIILRAFWVQILLSFVLLGATVVGTTTAIPAAYRVSNLEAIVPMAISSACHFIWPFALDPYFTT